MCHYDEKSKTLQDPWSVDDVLNQRPDLTEDHGCEVLSKMPKKKVPVIPMPCMVAPRSSISRIKLVK